MRNTLVGCSVLVLAAFCEAAPNAGNLILIGGGDKPKPVMAKFVELAGGKDSTIAVVPTASEEVDTGEYYQKLFAEDHGCTSVVPLALHSREDAQKEEIVAAIDAASGIFFAGGDQSRITRAILGTPTGAAIARAFARGAAIGGTSAGTACMSALMITGEGDFEAITADNVELVPGLGLFPGVIVDQHFIARKRSNRLISVILEHPDLVGVGIDEATAVWVRRDGTLQVLGEGSVMVLDASGAAVRRRERGEVAKALLGVTNLRVHLLLPGDVFDTTTRSLR